LFRLHVFKGASSLGWEGTNGCNIMLRPTQACLALAAKGKESLCAALTADVVATLFFQLGVASPSGRLECTTQ
jgi:hypothetical protein